jgi:hypothetical protein
VFRSAHRRGEKKVYGTKKQRGKKKRRVKTCLITSGAIQKGVPCIGQGIKKYGKNKQRGETCLITSGAIQKGVPRIEQVSALSVAVPRN